MVKARLSCSAGFFVLGGASEGPWKPDLLEAWCGSFECCKAVALEPSPADGSAQCARQPPSGNTSIGSINSWHGRFDWHMPGAADVEGVTGGFSWYTKMFSIFQEGYPLGEIQMGQASTWLQPGDTLPSCGCDTHIFDCCGNNCKFLYQTFEGGPGFWKGQLPSTKVKFRANSNVRCYDLQHASPMFRFDNPNAIECGRQGIVAVSNQMVMPPDGFGMEDEDGMLGVAYVKTPLGKIHDEDHRNFWTIVVDAENFAGPLAYWLPEFWKQRDASIPADLADIGTVKTMRGGAGDFEWGTWRTYIDSSGNYKMPKSALPGKKDGRSVLYGWNRHWNASEVMDPIEEALRTGSLDPSKIMARGSKMPCSAGSSPANIRVNSDQSTTIGTFHTTVEGNECVWSVDVNGCHNGDAKCPIPQYVSSSGQPMGEVDVSAELRNQQFPEKTSWGPWDALNHPPSGGCAQLPGPASSVLYCVKTRADAWLAWRWYKFTEQPGMAVANLTSQQKVFLQGRVERLHKMVGRRSKWLSSQGAAAEGLGSIDSALLVSPPEARMQFGYVPVAVYEGQERPNNCQAPPLPTALKLHAAKVVV